MRSSRHCADDTRGHGLTAIEKFDVNLLRHHAQCCELVFHVCHEPGRPAEVAIRISWKADLSEHRPRVVTGRGEVLTGLVARTRPRVAKISAATRERTPE